jgi:cytochrome P450
MTLLAAGHDTTATALSWALEQLTRHPAILARAVQAAEDSAAGDPAGDGYLDAICKETLRIRPVVFDVGRTLTAPIELGGYRLPAGVMVVPGVGLVHGSAATYQEPDRFDPDRMLGSDPRSTILGPTTWLPFGGGNRRCLGANFALVEMRVILREVLRRVEMCTTTAPGERQRVRGVILEPHRGARIQVRSRRPAATAAPSAAQCPVR